MEAEAKSGASCTSRACCAELAENTPKPQGTKASASQAQIAGQRLLLGRLQSLKASGRISLDLDPAQPALPHIALEDGDTITVPHRPSFVGVFGEVLAETSFIHKPAYNVSDYLDKAGLTRDADLDNALVIRADGSVLSNARKG